MEADCDRKFEELQKYIPFLNRTIRRLDTSSTLTVPQQATLNKLREMRGLLSGKRMIKMEKLSDFERILVKIKSNVEQVEASLKKAPENMPLVPYVSKTSPTTSNNKKTNLEDSLNKLRAVSMDISETGASTSKTGMDSYSLNIDCTKEIEHIMSAVIVRPRRQSKLLTSSIIEEIPRSPETSVSPSRSCTPTFYENPLYHRRSQTSKEKDRSEEREKNLSKEKSPKANNTRDKQIESLLKEKNDLLQKIYLLESGNKVALSHLEPVSDTESDFESQMYCDGPSSSSMNIMSKNINKSRAKITIPIGKVKVFEKPIEIDVHDLETYGDTSKETIVTGDKSDVIDVDSYNINDESSKQLDLSETATEITEPLKEDKSTEIYPDAKSVEDNTAEKILQSLKENTNRSTESQKLNNNSVETSNEIPLLHDKVSTVPKEKTNVKSGDVDTQIDILQNLKNDILNGDQINRISEALTPLLHQPKVTKVTNDSNLKKHISIDEYKQKAKIASPTVTPNLHHVPSKEKFSGKSLEESVFQSDLLRFPSTVLPDFDKICLSATIPPVDKMVSSPDQSHGLNKTENLQFLNHPIPIPGNAPAPDHSFRGSRCPPTPKPPLVTYVSTSTHPHILECPPTPSHSFGRSECSTTQQPHFSESDCSLTPIPLNSSQPECPSKSSHYFGQTAFPALPQFRGLEHPPIQQTTFSGSNILRHPSHVNLEYPPVYQPAIQHTAYPSNQNNLSSGPVYPAASPLPYHSPQFSPSEIDSSSSTQNIPGRYMHSFTPINSIGNNAPITPSLTIIRSGLDPRLNRNSHNDWQNGTHIFTGAKNNPNKINNSLNDTYLRQTYRDERMGSENYHNDSNFSSWDRRRQYNKDRRPKFRYHQRRSSKSEQTHDERFHSKEYDRRHKPRNKYSDRNKYSNKYNDSVPRTDSVDKFNDRQSAPHERQRSSSRSPNSSKADRTKGSHKETSATPDVATCSTSSSRESNNGNIHKEQRDTMKLNYNGENRVSRDVEHTEIENLTKLPSKIEEIKNHTKSALSVQAKTNIKDQKNADSKTDDTEKSVSITPDSSKNNLNKKSNSKPNEEKNAGIDYSKEKIINDPLSHLNPNYIIPKIKKIQKLKQNVVDTKEGEKTGSGNNKITKKNEASCTKASSNRKNEKKYKKKNEPPQISENISKEKKSVDKETANKLLQQDVKIGGNIEENVFPKSQVERKVLKKRKSMVIDSDSNEKSGNDSETENETKRKVKKSKRIPKVSREEELLCETENSESIQNLSTNEAAHKSRELNTERNPLNTDASQSVDSTDGSWCILRNKEPRQLESEKSCKIKLVKNRGITDKKDASTNKDTRQSKHKTLDKKDHKEKEDKTPIVQIMPIGNRKTEEKQNEKVNDSSLNHRKIKNGKSDKTTSKRLKIKTQNVSKRKCVTKVVNSNKNLQQTRKVRKPCLKTKTQNESKTNKTKVSNSNKNPQQTIREIQHLKSPNNTHLTEESLDCNAMLDKSLSSHKRGSKMPSTSNQHISDDSKNTKFQSSNESNSTNELLCDQDLDITKQNLNVGTAENDNDIFETSIENPTVLDKSSQKETMDAVPINSISTANAVIDKSYCFNKKRSNYNCCLCKYLGEDIVAHYRHHHPHSEIFISRLDEDIAKKAIKQSREFDIELLGKQQKKISYGCRFCYKYIKSNKMSALNNFFSHVVSTHTGEYEKLCPECRPQCKQIVLDIPEPPKVNDNQLIGYICGECNFTQISRKNLSAHITRHHNKYTRFFKIDLAVTRNSKLKKSMEQNDIPSTSTQSPIRRSVQSVNHDKRQLFGEDSDSDISIISMKSDEESLEDTKEQLLEDNPQPGACVEGKMKTEATSENEVLDYPQFKVIYSKSGAQKYVCCISNNESHYITNLKVSMNLHLQTNHKELWNGYCFVCKAIVIPKSQQLGFKECFQHFVDKHVNNDDERPNKPDEEFKRKPSVKSPSQSQSNDNSCSTPVIVSVKSLHNEDFKYEEAQAEVMLKKEHKILESMMTAEKLIHVFKCAGWYCLYSTYCQEDAFVHASKHATIGGVGSLSCAYCNFDCSGDSEVLVNHAFKSHGMCAYACGHCFYRAVAGLLVMAHAAKAHAGKEPKVLVSSAEPTPPEEQIVTPPEEQILPPLEGVVQKYVCSHCCIEGRNQFQTYCMEKFREHLDQQHERETCFSCSICRNTFKSSCELMVHMEIHGLDKYQCPWCVHGADSEAKYLEHAAAFHPSTSPCVYLRTITIKDGKEQMKLVKFSEKEMEFIKVISTADKEHPIREAEKSVLQENLVKDINEYLHPEDNAEEDHVSSIEEAAPANAPPKRKLSSDSGGKQVEPPSKMKYTHSSTTHFLQTQSGKTYEYPKDSDKLQLMVGDELINCGLCNFSSKCGLNIIDHMEECHKQQKIPETTDAEGTSKVSQFEATTTNSTKTISQKFQYPQSIPACVRFICGANGCTDHFENEDLFKQHWTTQHPRTAYFRCAHCSEDLSSLLDGRPSDILHILQHIQMHDSTLYACSGCNFYDYSKQSVKRHVETCRLEAATIITVRDEVENYDAANVGSSLSEKAGPSRNANSSVQDDHSEQTSPIDLQLKLCPHCEYRTLKQEDIIEHCRRVHAMQMNGNILDSVIEHTLNRNLNVSTFPQGQRSASIMVHQSHGPSVTVSSQSQSQAQTMTVLQGQVPIITAPEDQIPTSNEPQSHGPSQTVPQPHGPLSTIRQQAHQSTGPPVYRSTNIVAHVAHSLNTLSCIPQGPRQNAALPQGHGSMRGYSFDQGSFITPREVPLGFSSSRSSAALLGKGKSKSQDRSYNNTSASQGYRAPVTSLQGLNPPASAAQGYNLLRSAAQGYGVQTPAVQSYNALGSTTQGYRAPTQAVQDYNAHWPVAQGYRAPVPSTQNHNAPGPAATLAASYGIPSQLQQAYGPAQPLPQGCGTVMPVDDAVTAHAVRTHMSIAPERHTNTANSMLAYHLQMNTPLRRS